MKTLIIFILTLFQSIAVAQPSEDEIKRGIERLKLAREGHRLYSQIKSSGNFDYAPTINEQAAWDSLNMRSMEDAIRSYAPKLHEFSIKFLKIKNKSIDEFKNLKIIISNSYDINAYSDPDSNTILIPIGLIILAKIKGDTAINSLKIASMHQSKKIDNENFTDGVFKIQEHETKAIKKLLFINNNPNLPEKEAKLRNDYIISTGHKYPTDIIFPVIPDLESYLKKNLTYFSKNFSYEATVSGEKIDEIGFRELGEDTTVNFLEFFVAHEICHLINKDIVNSTTSHAQEIKADLCAIDGLRILNEDTDNIVAMSAFMTLLNISSTLVTDTEIQNRSKTHPHPVCRVKEILFNRKLIATVRNMNMLSGEANHLLDNISVNIRTTNKFCN